MNRTVFYTRYDARAGSSRTRAFEYVEPLRRRGFTPSVVTRVQDDGKLRAFDDVLNHTQDAAVVVHKPNLTARQLDALLQVSSGRLVADFDDAIWMGYGAGDPPEGIESIRSVLRAARTVTTGSEYLAQWARSLRNGPVVVIPPSVDLERYCHIRTHDVVARPVVVWIGTSGNFGDLEECRDVLQELIPEHAIRFRVVADRPLGWPDTEWVPWSFADEVEQLSACDIGIMPLVDNERSRGRCGYKAVQYQAAGLPVIASPVGGAQEVLQAGGVLASSRAEWMAALDEMARSPELRAELGRAGRMNVERRHSIEHNAGRLASACGLSAR